MDRNLHPELDWSDRPYCNLCDRPAFDATMIARLGEQSRLRLILIGFPEDVNREILNLHHCGYDLDAWSPPQCIPGTAEVVTVHIKRSRRASHR